MIAPSPSSRRALNIALVASVLSGACSALLIALLHRSLGATAAQLPRLGLGFSALCLAMLGLRWLSESRFVALKQEVVAHHRRNLSRQLAACPYRELEVRGPSALSTLIQDVAQVSELMLALPRLATQGAVVLGCLVYLAWLAWLPFLLAVLMIVLGSLAHLALGRRANRHFHRARASDELLFRQLRALFSGAKELLLHAPRRQAFLDRVLLPAIAGVRRERMRGLLLHAAATSWGGFLFFVVIGATVFVLGQALGLPGSVSAGYALIFLYLMHPMELLMEAIPELSRARIALERIASVATWAGAPLAALPEPQSPALARLELLDVTHSYRREDHDGEFVLGPLSLELRPGEIVFLIGGNGSGKTTLAKLLVGLYQPEAGAVRLNGERVEPAGGEAYRQHFSAVFADFHVFDRLLGVNAERAADEAHALLEVLELERKLRLTQGAFSTTQLSRGQQKRLALLVAWLEHRAVYVFDEWAADQDPAYRQVFYERLLPELKRRQKAVFVISHDDRYFHVADRCLKLDSGKLVPLAGEPPHREPARVLALPTLA